MPPCQPISFMMPSHYTTLSAFCCHIASHISYMLPPTQLYWIYATKLPAFSICCHHTAQLYRLYSSTLPARSTIRCHHTAQIYRLCSVTFPVLSTICCHHTAQSYQLYAANMLHNSINFKLYAATKLNKSFRFVLPHCLPYQPPMGLTTVDLNGKIAILQGANHVGEITNTRRSRTR
ncbi:hypothetical protein CHS0354_038699 [Potamilus streckersoni]|uniref:Uncharacterized protein n=1 Tax=Potamilus streckersoni TaxID=2493646 RepID=A0AAE0SG16_9BIVA|nr:hypothetical protein CHS0354_038699 [Potamilus streckersoni]